MYCVKCGANLADTEEMCPLCMTRVYHPDIERQAAEPLFPRERRPETEKRARILPPFLTAAAVAALLVVLLCDLQVNRTVTWSGTVAGAVLVGYVTLVLPIWFRRPNPVIFVPCAFAAVILYLLYLDLAAGGGWFLGFAFPVAGGAGLIVTALVTLLRYVRRGRLYTVGGALMALGIFMLPVELLLNRTFAKAAFAGWSVYPLVALVLLGGYLIFLAICRPLREAMERKFFF